MTDSCLFLCRYPRRRVREFSRVQEIRRRGWIGAAIVCCWASVAMATPERMQAELEAVARQHKIPVFMRDRGTFRRPCLNPHTTAQIKAVSQVLDRQANVLQLCHWDGTIDGQGTGAHTETIYRGMQLHLQNIGGNWRLTSWHQPYADWLAHNDYVQRNGGQSWRIHSAPVWLPDNARAAYGEAMKRAIAEQGESGGIVKALGLSGFNCASGYTGLPLAGQTLSQIVGLSGSSSDPRGFQTALEQQGNERVFSIIVYGGPLKDFGAKPDQLLFGR